MKKFLILAVLLLVSSMLYSDTGYVSKNVYANAWFVPASPGNTLVDLVLPYPIWLDMLIVGGDQNGIMSAEITGVSKMECYPFPAWVPVGNVLQNSVYIPTGTHLLIKLVSGAVGNYTITISGRLVTP